MCTWRRNDFRFRIHRNDRNQADHAPGDELPEYRYCRAVSCPWHGCYTGACFTGVISILGYNNLWKFSGCPCNTDGDYSEYHSSERRKKEIIDKQQKRKVPMNFPFSIFVSIYRKSDISYSLCMEKLSI